jgi:CO dehydrogenase/acetyl-CoA synthase alpha subunit
MRISTVAVYTQHATRFTNAQRLDMRAGRGALRETIVRPSGDCQVYSSLSGRLQRPAGRAMLFAIVTLHSN